MKSTEIRSKFIDFFVKRGHVHVPSSSLIPADDPTLLFANAGMNQFKDLFLGKERRSYNRAVSIQKCIRAGGKHNDLEQVGFTKRHLTFFEMMGNFSFGDYFKRDAIIFAWDFLTKDIGLDVEKLYATVYRLDDEAYNIWRDVIKLPENRIVRLGESDNFWQMGETGPCGPCSEIYIDRGTSFGCGSKTCAPGCACDRFLEIWNLVFMQFDRQPDGTDKPLKQTGVDTGMGLDRLCAVVQNKESVFEIDIFEPLIAAIEQLTGKAYSTADNQTKGAFRVLVDHVRSASFAIADGCTPSNEGRGYVLRKIIRRAALFAQKLSSDNFFPQVADALIKSMGSVYPELIAQKKLIINLLTSEIEKFSQNLVSGQAVLEKYMANQGDKIITAAQAFKLYDTYGFPLELTKVIAQQKGYSVDVEGFDREMQAQRVQSGKKSTDHAAHLPDLENLHTIFTGYDEFETETLVTGIISGSELVNEGQAGKNYWIITERSPFYVACGGQVNDQGFVIIHNQKVAITDLKKIDGAIAFQATLPVAARVGDKITLQVDRQERLATMKNHTATHLLQAALIQVIGKSVKQSGSLVAPDYLRFDFTHYENLSPEQITQVEDLVNAKIMENIPVSITHTTLKDATSQGVIAFFGEKYNPEQVRVIKIPGFSAELCGGTHVRATGDIGCFKITESSSLSAGNRRIVAVTGPQAVKVFQETFTTVKQLTQLTKAQATELIDFVNKQKDTLKSAQHQVSKLRHEVFIASMPHWLAQVSVIGTVPFGYIQLEDATAHELKEFGLALERAQSGFYFVVSMSADRMNFFATLGSRFVDTVSLPNLAKHLQEFKLKGGATAITLQGGGPLIAENLKDILTKWLAAQ